MVDALGSGLGVKVGNPQQLRGVTASKPQRGLLVVPVRGPKGEPGDAAPADVDPVLSFDNALA